MQSERQFKFLIYPEANTLKDSYIDLKANFEKLVNHIKERAIYYEKDDICLACRLHDGIFFTLYIKEQTPIVAIYDSSTKKLSHECSYEDIDKILKTYSDIIIYTLEDNLSKQKGGVFQWKRIQEAWKLWFSQLEATKNSETPAEQLKTIAIENFLNEEFCLNIAKHPNADRDSLKGLSHSPYIEVKIAVLQHPNTSLKTLYQLLNDTKVIQYGKRHPGLQNIMNQILTKQEIQKLVQKETSMSSLSSIKR